MKSKDYAGEDPRETMCFPVTANREPRTAACDE